MDRNYETAFKNCVRNNECDRQAVPECVQTCNRETALVQGKDNIYCTHWSDQVNYGTFGPLTHSGIIPYITEYQLAYNRGSLSPLQTVFPHSWTYEPHWSTAPMLNTANLHDFPMRNRVRFDLDNVDKSRLPPVPTNVPNDMKNLENPMVKQDATVPEWTLRDPYRVNLVDALRDDPIKIKANTLKMCQEENQRITNMESSVKQKLGERVKDLNYRRQEIVSETEKLEQEIRNIDAIRQNMEREILELEGPLRISLDNTGVRRLKKNDNAVMYLDSVDYELSKEQDMINKAREVYRTMVSSLLAQKGRNRVLLDELYRDSSNKHKALNIDQKSYGFNHSSSEVQAFSGTEVFENTQNSVSTPESWAQASSGLILRSQTTRAESDQLRQEADQLLKRTMHDLWQQWFKINEALRSKISQMEDYSRQLRHRYTILIQELNDLIRDSDLLRRNMEDKIKPLKLAQTRLHWRSNRAGIENCHDTAHQSLSEELNEIHAVIDRLQKRLKEVENSINYLNYTKTSLENEIKSASNAIHRDREKCLAIRDAFPVSFRPCISN